jgi:hypothetical protein
MSSVEDLLTDVLRHDFEQNVVRRQSQRVLVKQQTFGQERVQVMRAHNVIFPSETNGLALFSGAVPLIINN